MAHDPKNHIHFDGMDGDFVYFSVRSRSRGSGVDPLRHTVVICKRTGFISCLCEDSSFRSKTARIDDPHAPLCWHSRQVKRYAAQVVGAMFGSKSRLRGEE